MGQQVPNTKKESFIAKCNRVQICAKAFNILVSLYYLSWNPSGATGIE